MALISVTRLRVRSILYLLPFMWQAIQSSSQAERAQGFLGGRVLREPGNVFWTVTAWESDQAMAAYRRAGAHGSVMPKLLNWCDEAAVVHWTQASAEPPSWPEAYRRMAQEGRPSKVHHPSASHAANEIPPPRPGRAQRNLKPARPHVC